MPSSSAGIVNRVFTGRLHHGAGRLASELERRITMTQNSADPTTGSPGVRQKIFERGGSLRHKLVGKAMLVVGAVVVTMLVSQHLTNGSGTPSIGELIWTAC